MSTVTCEQMERRRQARQSATAPIAVSRVLPVLPLADVQVLNTSTGGIALRTATPLPPGERLSFTTHHHLPPILGEVLACEPLDDNTFRLRCRCLLGTFGS